MPKVFPLLVVALLLSACSREPDLVAVTLPSLTETDAAVQRQAQARFDALERVRAARSSPAELGNAYGQFAMLMHAAEYFDAAKPAYQNAQTLMPDDARWPYLLAHLSRRTGDTAQATALFKRVLELQPDDVPARIWLARLYIDQGQPELAEPLLIEAQKTAPGMVAVLAALGQTALARRDYTRAVALLEEALAIEPTAASVHSPLALAYRALGNQQRADEHLKQWRNTDILFPDPWRQELDLTLESGLSYEIRGVRALEQRDFATAAEQFAKGLTMTPDTTPLGRSLRHKLGTAQFLRGNVSSAVEHFNAVVRAAPAQGVDESSARAHYSLGVIAISANRVDEALQRFGDAVRYNPNYLEARMGLADALRRSGKAEASLEHYREALRVNPRTTEARLGYAMALARLRRFQAARNWLEEGIRAQPDRPELTHALARLLAAAPDPRVRDGERALSIASELLKTDKTTTLGETLAMALAEVGDFERSAGVQRGIIAAARQAGLAADVRRMEANLRLYERGQRCRTPWADDDPLYASRSLREP